MTKDLCLPQLSKSWLKGKFSVSARCEIYKTEACICQQKSFGSPLCTVFQASITETEQNNSIDTIKHLFICVAVIVSVHTF